MFYYYYYYLLNIPLLEFKEFPLKKIRGLEQKFKEYDADQDHGLNIEELKKLMEGLGEPQTHRCTILRIIKILTVVRNVHPLLFAHHYVSLHTIIIKGP